jgi:predicted transcriptional regulator
MNDFNRVFMVIKKHCEKQKLIAEVNSLEVIAKDTKIPVDKLPLYLDYLQEAGLIKYSLTEKYIHLTTFGKKQESLVKE